MALDYETRMRWNNVDTWVWSKDIVHPPLISLSDFRQAQQCRAERNRPWPHERVSRHHDYALRGLVSCGLCRRRMGTQWSHESAYTRCRFASEYAVANKVQHPKNVLIRENAVVPYLDRWIGRQFAPGRKADLVKKLHEAQAQSTPDTDTSEAAAIVRDCDAKLARYRALIDSEAAGSATVAQWIAETEALRATAVARMQIRKPVTLSRERVAELVHSAGNIAELLRTADTAEKNRLYRALGVRMTYHPAQHKMLVEIAPDQHSVGEWLVSEGECALCAHAGIAG